MPAEAGYQVHDLGRPRPGKAGYLLKLPRARRLIRSIGPEVVHAHFATSYGLIALASGARPLVVTAHGDDVLIAPDRAILGRIVRRVLRAAALITVPADHMRLAVEALLGSRAGSTPVAVFQYGVEASRLLEIGEAARADRVEDGTVRIVSTRAMLDLYRLDLLVDALAVLRDRGVEFRCDLAGDGPRRDDLEQRVARNGLDAFVRFHGQLESMALEQLVANADVYVSVAESDGVSIGLLEALALGPVPVLSDIPANRSWINPGETGIIVEADAHSLADGIEQAVLLDRDRVARDNHAVVAERADRFTNLAACELLIDELIGVRWDPRPADAGDASAA